MNTTAAAFLLLALVACAALAAIDARLMIMPDILNLAVFVSALGFHLATDWMFLSPADAIGGALAGAGPLYGFRFLYLRIRGIQAIGLGDIKFMAAAGLWVGASHLPILLFVASVATLLSVLLLRAIAPANTNRIFLGRRVPFGPGLCIAMLLTIANSIVSSGLL
jgi:prepilin signal peptidase PulO-like enzyme (type II secretory pathway)